jgi:penicillin-binding protein-related factor A (putative recombinase)
LSVPPGKRFEQDFSDSLKKITTVLRIKDHIFYNDPACNRCPHNKKRFSSKNICDFIAIAPSGFVLMLELKTTKLNRIPIKSIIKNIKDQRLEKMTHLDVNPRIKPMLIVNYRSLDNLTLAVDATDVFEHFLKTNKMSLNSNDAKSMGIQIPSYKKRTRYLYNLTHLIPRTENGL